MSTGSKQDTISRNNSSVKLSPAERVAEDTVRAASFAAGLKDLETNAFALDRTIDQNGGTNSTPDYNRQQSNKV